MAMQSATGAEIIVRLLENQGVRTVAGIPGGAVIPLYEALSKSSIQHVLVRHEQAAGFFAQGMARATGKPAVCVATSGPGVMNLLTAVADAKADSVPLVIITGQVARSFIGTDAFQEADTFGLSLPITKHNILIKETRDLLTAIPEAFAIACSGRPGPVLIDVPVDVQRERIRVEAWPAPGARRYRSSRFRTQGAELVLQCAEFARALLSAERPLLFVGGGCNTEETARYVADFLGVFPLPVVSSLMGLGVVSAENPLFYGMSGVYGRANARKLLQTADVVVAAGVRFDERAVGNPPAFREDARILHIDVDAAEINKIIGAYRAVVSDVESAIPVLTECLRQAEKEVPRKSRADWFKPLEVSAREEDENRVSVFSVTTFDNCTQGEAVMRLLPRAARAVGTAPETIRVVGDVGQHQMWCARSYPFVRPKQFFTSGALGTMGFALPAALGVAVALRGGNSVPNRFPSTGSGNQLGERVETGGRVLCVSGDGAIMMNLQELATLAELWLDVTVLVFDNASLGMVRQLQDKQCKKRHFAVNYEKPTNIARVMEAFGIPTRTVGAGTILQGAEFPLAAPQDFDNFAGKLAAGTGGASWAAFAFPAPGSGPRALVCKMG